MTDDEKVIADVEAMTKTPEHRAKRNAFAAALLRRQKPRGSWKGIWPIVTIGIVTAALVWALVQAAGG